MALTDYQKLWGPRWHVTGRTKDNNGSFPPNIDIDDALDFKGDGDGDSTCELWNLTQNVKWGVECIHPHPDLGRSNRLNEVKMKRPATANIWIITRSLLGSGRYQIEARAGSGGGSWTANEGG